MDMSRVKNDFKKLAVYIAIPLILGAVVGFLTSGGTDNYNGIVPGWIFPIVWTVLYILMGIASYLVRNNMNLVDIYKLNLFVNLTWPFIFFTFDFKVLAFFWILLLILIVGIMIYGFYKENKIAGYLLIPYIFWLIFAAILNLLQII